MNSKLLTYAEVAERIGVPIGTVYSMVCRRQIPHVRLGPRTVRFSPEAVEAWIAGRHVATGNHGPDHVPASSAER
jgi:excisionase family DNA binding protein